MSETGTWSFLKARMFPQMLVASACAMSLYVLERSTVGWSGPRLHLNLFLAWIPYAASLGLVALHQRGIAGARFWALFLVWFFFFPNAPYLITDYIYLSSKPHDVWQRLVIFASFSFTGVTLGLISLFLVQGVVRARSGIPASRVVVALAVGLAGLGVFLGRFLRWNSWDLITRPGAVLENVMTSLNTVTQGVRPLAFSIVLSLLLLVFYWVLVSFRRAEDA